MRVLLCCSAAAALLEERLRADCWPASTWCGGALPAGRWVRRLFQDEQCRPAWQPGYAAGTGGAGGT
ncbi:MAG: hypothetical protein ACK4ZJ_18475, partial [Allorhizobium sp.]